ncbi:hypothetical protein PINS_up013164 [Pythium insidiosum]|nr:hypothetical protein PINS_up013164 [Pythium insidiosum]
MAFHYVATAQKPTSVTHALTAAFTGPNDRNLLLAKSTRFEVHAVTPDGLVPLHDVALYGRIIVFETFRAPNEPTDWIFIVTQRFQFCVLAYDSATRQIVTKAHGHVRDAIGRCSDLVTSGNIDPEGRLIGMNLYEGYFKVIPIDQTKMNGGASLKEAFNIRLDELRVIDIKFLHGYTKPTICVLYEDCKGARHVKTYVILLKEKDFAEGPWHHANVEAGASLLIPVPMPLGGVLIVSQQTIVYHNGSTYHVIPMQSTVIQVYGSVDKDGSRFLLADQYGALSVVSLQHNGKDVSNLFLEVLGETSVASCLAYLDNGVVFVGSTFGDSQLIKLHAEPDEETGSYVEVLDRYVNIGPITDFCVMDLDRQGQGQIVTCSGADKDGSLRVIRNGIGINEQAVTEMPGIKGMWALRESFASEHDKYLLQSYVNEIRVLAIDANDEMEEREIPAFANTKTLLCRNLLGDAWLQVTESEIRVIDSQRLTVCSTWAPPAGVRITVAGANPTQVVIATSGGVIVYLEVSNRQLVEMAQTRMEFEIACIDVTPTQVPAHSMPDDGDVKMGGGYSASNGLHWETNLLRSSICVVGLWTSFSVCVLQLPSLQHLTKEPLGNDLLPRSVLCSSFDDTNYLMVGLGDGSLINFQLDPATGALSSRKRVSLGSQPISLSLFRSKDTTHVFASCDRPTVIYSNNNKLLFSNVNTKEVSVMCPFNPEAFPECLALASEELLTIGTVDDIQKLHIQTVPLNEWARRIAHCPQSHTLGVLSIRFTVEDNGDEVENGFVRLFDDQTFELLHSFKLDPLESPCSIVNCTFSGDSSNLNYFVVGTAYVRQDEAEPHKGRLLVFSVAGIHGERTLQLVTEHEVKGAVYSLNSFNGRVLAGVNSKTQLYKWSESPDNERELVSECGHYGHTLVLYMESRGDFIIVGDLMKSITLLNYKQLDGTIEEIAKDLNSNWMSAVGILDDDTYVGAETDFNLFVVQRNSGAASDEERGRLETIAEFHLGEFVNRFRFGSLVMQNTAGANLPLPPTSDMVDVESSTTSMDTPHAQQSHSHQSMLFATVSGMIGVILSINKEQYQWLSRLQAALNKVVKGVGGFSHKEWRTYETRRLVCESRHIIDGDLIESILDLSKSDVAKVVDHLNNDGQMESADLFTVDDILARVEELAQLH